MVACEILHPFPNTIIRASAGTGKTFQLALRFLSLLHAGERADHVLAATFARKAAGEILERLLLRLADAARDPAELALLDAQIREQVDAGPLDRARCLELLRELISQLHRLRVGTLDSFFIQIAGSFSLDLGLPPRWGILEEVTDAALRDRAIQEVLADGSPAELAALLRLLSKGRLLSSVSGELLQTVQSIYGVYRETTPDAFTGTIPASWQCLPRHKRLDAAEIEVAIGEILAVTLPAHKTFANGVRGNIEAAQEEDWRTFLEKGLTKKILEGAEKFATKPIPEELIGPYRALIEHAKAVLVNQIADQTETTWRMLHRFHQSYHRLKLEARGIRFEDVTRLLSTAMGGLADSELSYRLDMQICQLLLDEFQDTSLAQWAVMRPFAELAAEDPSRSFFCVGDVKQAIYGWRGGVSELFAEVEQQLPDTQVLPLDQSYRSSKIIVETVNLVFGNLPANPVLTENFLPAAERWHKNFSPQSTARQLPGYAELMTAPRATDEEDQTAVTLNTAAELVARLHRESPELSIGVLTRRNAAVGRLIYQLRRTHLVDASEEGGNPLTDSAAVQLVMALLTLADHPGDTVSRYHLAHSPLGSLVGLTNPFSESQAGEVSSKVRADLLQQGYGRTVYHWVSGLAASCDERDLRRLMQLVELAYVYEHRATESTGDFLRTVLAHRVEDPTSAAVRVMNVHQSKGLQFDIVVLPELDLRLTPQPPAMLVGRPTPTAPINTVCRYIAKPLFPLVPAELAQVTQEQQQQAVGEGVCWFYVAMTRAVHALHLLVSPGKENENSLPKTFAGVLRSTLSDGALVLEPSKVIWQLGDENWRASREKSGDVQSSHAARSADKAPPEPPVIRLATSDAQRRRRFVRESPSSLEGGRKLPAERLLQWGTSAAAARGLLIHAWFEQIEWLDDGPPDEALLQRVAQQNEHADLDIARERQHFDELLSDPKIAGCLSRSAYSVLTAPQLWPADIAALVTDPATTARVQNERRFMVRDGARLLNGMIDRLVLFSQAGKIVAAEILDYKTDALNPRDEQAILEKLEYYRPQQAAYRDAVAQTYKLTPTAVSVRVLFLTPRRILAIPPA